MTEIQGGPAVPFVFSNVFEQDILHVTVAETAEQTGHNRSLRNPSTLTICSATQRAKNQVKLSNGQIVTAKGQIEYSLCTFP